MLMGCPGVDSVNVMTVDGLTMEESKMRSFFLPLVGRIGMAFSGSSYPYDRKRSRDGRMMTFEEMG